MPQALFLVLLLFHMNKENPRILLLGDYSNCQNTLATGLRKLGCDVTLVSDGCGWMECDRDFTLRRAPGATGALRYMMQIVRSLDKTLSGYDIVSLNDLNFLQLRPWLLKHMFDIVRKNNSSVYLNAMSTDIAYLDMVTPPGSPLRYSEWFIGDRPSPWHIEQKQRWDKWHGKELVSYQNYALDHIDGAVSVLYEYHLGMVRRLGEEKCAYGGIPVDVSRYEPVGLPDKIERVRIFLGRDKTRKAMKGSDLLEIAAKRVVEKHPDKAELVIVENRPFNEFTDLLRSAHLVLDQIYSYTPATTALMAMAYGLNVVSGGEPEYYDFIGEKDNRPVINAPIELEPLVKTIENVVLHPETIRPRGLASREFVIKHNSSDIVAKRYLDFWTG